MADNLPLAPSRRLPTHGVAYTRELADSIWERMANGENLIDICAEEGMPSYSSVYTWWSTDVDGCYQRYARARDAQRAWRKDRIDQAGRNPRLGVVVTNKNVVVDGTIVPVREERVGDAVDRAALELKALMYLDEILDKKDAERIAKYGHPDAPKDETGPKIVIEGGLPDSPPPEAPQPEEPTPGP